MEGHRIGSTIIADGCIAVLELRGHKMITNRLCSSARARKHAQNLIRRTESANVSTVAREQRALQTDEIHEILETLGFEVKTL